MFSAVSPDLSYWSEGGEAYAAPELSGTEPVKEREKVIAEVGLPTAATGLLGRPRGPHARRKRTHSDCRPPQPDPWRAPEILDKGWVRRAREAGGRFCVKIRNVENFTKFCEISQFHWISY